MMIYLEQNINSNEFSLLAAERANGSWEAYSEEEANQQAYLDSMEEPDHKLGNPDYE